MTFEEWLREEAAMHHATATNIRDQGGLPYEVGVERGMALAYENAVEKLLDMSPVSDDTSNPVQK